MPDTEKQSCPNSACPDHKKIGAGNIAVRGKFGKNMEKTLLYCRTCGKRFSSSKGTLFHGTHLSTEKIREIIRLYSEDMTIRGIASALGITKVTVNSVILKVSAHSQIILTELMETLWLDPKGMEHLFALVKKRNLLGKKDKTPKK
jgi:hypothetical protein